MKVGKWHQRLAYGAAGASALSVLLAVIGKLTGQLIVITIPSYMSFAVVAVFFAIYFLVQGMVKAE